VETVRESGISSYQVAMRTLQIFASGLASGIGTLTALSLYTSNNPSIRPSLLLLQRRAVTDKLMTYDLALDDGRWDEAFQLAAESSRDGTWNRLWKGFQNLPAAPGGAQSNEEFITKLEAHMKNRKDFRNYTASPVSSAESNEVLKHSHLSHPMQRFLTEDSRTASVHERLALEPLLPLKQPATTKGSRCAWLWACCYCSGCSPTAELSTDDVERYLSCFHARCQDCALEVRKSRHNACDSKDTQTDYSVQLSAKFEVGNSVWLTIPKESSVKVEVVARRREDLGEYLYQVKDTSGVLYEDEKGKWVSERRLTKF